MDIRFYNTLTHRMETFKPIEEDKVTMYNCGPTVYDYAHIGNFRAFVFADVLRRFLELVGYDVHQVMNITDVGHMTDDQLADGGGEDKMEAAAKRLKASKKDGKAAVDNPDDPYAVAKFFTDAFVDDAKKLGLKIADEYPDNMPHATANIDAMQAMIGKLLETDHAYVSPDGAVYYSVESFPDYGKLSGNTLDKLRGGAGGRVQDEHQAGKRHPADFLLWKPDKSHLMKWDSPWGEGYPGWHIECSAMATRLLQRDTIDIHTGGEDNIFPHHECEIAQTRGATGNDHFARFWMHTRFLLVEGEKMSKSKGNFFTVRDVLDGKVTGRAVDPRVLRYELLRTHYRQNMNFTVKGLQDSASAVQKLHEQYVTCYDGKDKATLSVGLEHPVIREFAASMADDLAVGKALGEVFTWSNTNNEDGRTQAGVLNVINAVIGFVTPGISRFTATDRGVSSVLDEAAAKCKAIDAARAAKDYDTADKLRDELTADGYEVLNTSDGTVAKKKLA